MENPAHPHTHKNLFFHHFILCNSIPFLGERPVLDPALLDGLEGGAVTAGLSDFIEGSNGADLRFEDWFVLKDIEALKPISDAFKYIFFIVCESDYQADLPSFFFDEWDPLLTLESMELLGWTVYAFSEPAIFFGSYPISIHNNAADFNDYYINEWGLIRNKFLADDIAKKNNELSDENKGHWRPLGIYVEKKILSRLKSAVGGLKSEVQHPHRG